MTTNLASVCRSGLTAFLVGCVLAIMSGCASVNGRSAMAYVRGDLDATLDVPLASAVRAANLAGTQLKFDHLSEKQDARQAVVLLRNAADKRVEIRLESVAESSTKLKIRVGAFGDEAVALATYLKISENL